MAPTPMWMRPGWLPKLLLIQWERLDCLREEHERLLVGYYRPTVPALHRRFGAEDAELVAAERTSVATGQPPTEVEVTSPARRKAMLEPAEERDAGALEAVCRHVLRVVAEVFANDEEITEAINAGRESSGLPTLQQAAQEAGGEPEGLAEMLTGPPTEIMERQNRAAAARQDEILRYLPNRKLLDADIETLGALRLTALSARGANVQSEVERACPGITAGAAEVGMMGALVGGVDGLARAA